MCVCVCGQCWWGGGGGGEPGRTSSAQRLSIALKLLFFFFFTTERGCLLTHAESVVGSGEEVAGTELRSGDGRPGPGMRRNRK